MCLAALWQLLGFVNASNGTAGSALEEYVGKAVVQVSGAPLPSFSLSYTPLNGKKGGSQLFLGVCYFFGRWRSPSFLKKNVLLLSSPF